MNLYEVSHLVRLTRNKLNELEQDGILKIAERGGIFEITDFATGFSEDEAIFDSIQDMRLLYHLYVIDSKSIKTREWG